MSFIQLELEFYNVTIPVEWAAFDTSGVPLLTRQQAIDETDTLLESHCFRMTDNIEDWHAFVNMLMTLCDEGYLDNSRCMEALGPVNFAKHLADIQACPTSGEEECLDMECPIHGGHDD